MWNEEIKQNIIKELNEQFDTIFGTVSAENHSYSDSIFSPITTNMYKPVNIDSCVVPNYFETTINRMREIKEIPIHTLAFSDSFEPKTTKVGFAYSPSFDSVEGITRDKVNPYSEIWKAPISMAVSDNICDMSQIIKSEDTITFSLTPEQRNVAIAKKVTWKDILFNDVTLIKNTGFAGAIKKICEIQINF